MIDLKKYNIPVPRYTSYPTVPLWDNESFDIEGYKQSLATSFWESNKNISIYIHLPFCESLCTYCACNTRITKNHLVEEPYIDYLLKEWALYLQAFPVKATIKEVHLGGGTPTFFKPKNLKKLLTGIFQNANVSETAQLSFEGHPANTTASHLQALKNLGFNRLSLGIQDFDLNVQKLINRLQTFDQVAAITRQARDIGYTSINYDMVYGLPGQTYVSLFKTLDKISELNPDRIAFYSYAHVPAMRPAQRSYEDQLPSAEDKYELSLLGRKKFAEFGYEEVGMDHFVRPTDELRVGMKAGTLHRNFMGYTSYASKVLIGLGASAIGDAWTGFGQNARKIEDYYQLLDNNEFPIEKGHLHTRQDLFIRELILNLMCRFETTWDEDELLKHLPDFDFTLLRQLRDEGFLTLSDNGIKVKPAGRQVIRNICSVFDSRSNSQTKKYSNFSQAV